VTPIGGLARRAAEVDRIRGESDGVLQVDAGDLFLPRGDEVEAQRTGLRPPTPGEVERRARLIAAAYARLGVAAFTPGERDLALGVPLLRRVLADAEIPVVSANLVDTRGELLFPADRLVEVSGVKVFISTELRTISRAAACDATWPSAMAWIKMLPSAVHSVGPASTGIFIALAAHWLSIVSLLPPPTMCSRSIFLPVNRSMRRSTTR